MGRGINQSIDRTLQVLELFSVEKPEWGVTEISEALNFYKSTVHGILSTLEARGFIEKNPVTGKYWLGIKFLELGSVVLKELDVRTVAQPYMEKLSREFNETVHLGVLVEGEVLSIEQKESSQSLRLQMYIGKRAPLHCTAVGKALMAYLPDEKITEIVNTHGLRRYTEHTITDLDALKAELEKIRAQGYAVDNMEHEEGVRCIAAPIRDSSGEVVASMSISGPAYRINEQNDAAIAARVKACCEEISAKMGYRDPAVQRRLPRVIG